MRKATLSRDAAETIRQACVEAALTGYEDALLSGLCREGAWEAAIGAIRRLDLENGVGEANGPDSQPDAPSTRDLSALTAELAGRFASPGPPAAGSGVAVTGATAAGLLRWVLGHLENVGTRDLRDRARRMRRRVAVVESALAADARRDAELVAPLLASRPLPRDALDRATCHALGIAKRCAQVATLALETSADVPAAFRPDLAVALRLSWSAGQAALDLLDVEGAPSGDGSGSRRDLERDAWRVRLLLRRAAAAIRSGERGDDESSV